MQPGTQLGHYEILSPLGKAGIREVAIQRSLND